MSRELGGGCYRAGGVCVYFFWGGDGAGRGACVAEPLARCGVMWRASRDVRQGQPGKHFAACAAGGGVGVGVGGFRRAAAWHATAGMMETGEGLADEGGVGGPRGRRAWDSAGEFGEARSCQTGASALQTV